MKTSILFPKMRFSILFIALFFGIQYITFTPTTAAFIADPSLVAHWSLDESTGVDVLDSSSHNNTGTITNTPSRVIGKIGRALSFTNTNQYVSIGSSGDNANTNLTQFSIAFWIKTTVNQAASIISDSNSGFNILICDGGSIGIKPGNHNTVLFCGSPSLKINDGEWHHVVFTYNGLARVHIDGSLNNSEAAQWAWGGGTPLHIGGIKINRTPSNTRGGFTGLIDDIRIYNRQLNAVSPDDDVTVLSNDAATLFSLGSAENTTPPYLIFTPTPETVVIASSTVIGFARQAETEITCTLNIDIIQNCGSPVNLNNLTNGNYELTIIATDVLQNSSQISHSFIVAIPITTSNPGSDDDQDGPPGVINNPSTDDDQDGSTDEHNTNTSLEQNTNTPPTENSNEDLVVTESVPTTSNNTTGSSRSGSRSSTNWSILLSSIPPTTGTIGGGRVLGAFSSCGIYLKNHLRYGEKNDSQDVEKLQAILNEVVDARLELTGLFDKKTLVAVKKFQIAHKRTVIDPWIENGMNPRGIATGIVGTTTIWTINNLVCPDLKLPAPVI